MLFYIAFYILNLLSLTNYFTEIRTWVKYHCSSNQAYEYYLKNRGLPKPLTVTELLFVVIGCHSLNRF